MAGGSGSRGCDYGDIVEIASGIVEGEKVALNVSNQIATGDRVTFKGRRKNRDAISLVELESRAHRYVRPGARLEVHAAAGHGGAAACFSAARPPWLRW